MNLRSSKSSRNRLLNCRKNNRPSYLNKNWRLKKSSCSRYWKRIYGKALLLILRTNCRCWTMPIKKAKKS
ncbi:hypothetical protein D3C87_1590180 [compost metagenome]